MWLQLQNFSSIGNSCRQRAATDCSTTAAAKTGSFAGTSTRHRASTCLTKSICVAHNWQQDLEMRRVVACSATDPDAASTFITWTGKTSTGEYSWSADSVSINHRSSLPRTDVQISGKESSEVSTCMAHIPIEVRWSDLVCFWCAAYIEEMHHKHRHACIGGKHGCMNALDCAFPTLEGCCAWARTYRVKP